MGPISSLILRRLLQAIVVMLGLTLYLFLILEYSPADPRYAALGIYASAEQREQLAEELDLDSPVIVRYTRYVRQLISGDLGISVFGQRPVADVLGERIGVTFSIAVSTIIMATLIAFVLGVSSAYFAGSSWDAFVRTVTFAALAMPVFWLALVLIQLFALKLTWLPAGAWVPFSENPIGWLRSLILPSLSISLPAGGFLTRVVRSSVLDELERDYVRTARGVGLKDRLVLRRNVLRNALVAPLTVLGLQAGYLLGGAVLVEVVFNLPGLGLLMLSAANQGDIGIIFGIALVAAIMFVLSNMLADVAFVVFKPSAREGT